MSNKKCAGAHVNYACLPSDINKTAVTRPSQVSYRKYKDYVYMKMLVQEYLKKFRLYQRLEPHLADSVRYYLRNAHRYMSIYIASITTTLAKRLHDNYVRTSSNTS